MEHGFEKFQLTDQMDQSLINGKSKAILSKWDSLSRTQVEHALSLSRREFLRGAAGLALGSTLMGASPFLRAESARKRRKVIVVTFGGGARDQETFAPEGQEN